jgi:26S proteasome regulatory subunit N4
MGITYEATKPPSAARARALELMQQRDAQETEMAALTNTLTAPGGPGLSGNLVDADGFPRADIDIPSIRTQRYRLDCLKNDHKATCKQLDAALLEALAPAGDAGTAVASASASEPEPAVPAAPAPSSERVPASTPAAPQSSRVPVPAYRVAFAVVDAVSPGSPAASAGLRVGDHILTFGAVSLHSLPSANEAMRALPGLLHGHRGRPLDIVVSRPADAGGVEGVEAREMVTMDLTPMEWAGSGLLGCHIVPAEVSQEDVRYAPQVATAVATRVQGDGISGTSGLNSHMNS